MSVNSICWNCENVIPPNLFFCQKCKKIQPPKQVDEFKLMGRHNLLNAMAAVSVGKLLKLSKKSIQDSLINFKSIEHRLEKVLKIQNITYINDSKATNVNAAFFALDCMINQTVWIVGGIDKGNDYDQLLPLVREKVNAIVC